MIRENHQETPEVTIPKEIDTPEIMVDVDILDRNIERMASAVGAKGLRLRPHAKTHKIPEIAARQIAAGASGLTVATIGEAEVFAAAGVHDLFIAYPLWVSPQKAERLRRLSQTARIAVGVDSAEGATMLGSGLGSAAGSISVLVEVDSGHHRSGVQPEAVAPWPKQRRGGAESRGSLHLPGAQLRTGHAGRSGPAGAAGPEPGVRGS